MVGYEFLFLRGQSHLRSYEEFDGFVQAFILFAELLRRLDDHLFRLPPVLLHAELAADHFAQHLHFRRIGVHFAFCQGCLFAIQFLGQFLQAFRLFTVLMLKAVDLAFRNRKVTQGIHDIILGRIIVLVEAIHFFVRLAQVFRETHILLDEFLSAVFLV